MWLTRWKHWKTVSATSKNLTSITLGSGSKPVLWLLSEAPCNCTGTSMKTMALIIWSHPGSPRIISKDILGICVEWVATIPIPLPSNFCTECKGKLPPPSSKMKGQRDNWSYNFWPGNFTKSSFFTKSTVTLVKLESELFLLNLVSLLYLRLLNQNSTVLSWSKSCLINCPSVL